MSEEMDDASRTGSREAADDMQSAAEPEAGEGLTSREAELAAECTKLRDQLLRTAADYDNYRKRARRDVDDAGRRGTEDTIRDFLPIIDNLERATAAAATAADVQAVAAGVQMVLKQFEDVGSRWGLQRVQAVGERFDPAQHDAVQQVETTDHPPATIMHEVTAGYRLGERLLRPALVVVARPPASATAVASEASGEADVPASSEPDGPAGEA